MTGGQRLQLYADYLAPLEARGLDRAPLAGYLVAFQYGKPPHGGLAMGPQRWVA